MKSIVPYTKEIKFSNKLAEICSISLEPNINIGESEIEGCFVISGEYKSHKISVNKDSFNYELPFTVDVTEAIKESIEFEVTDFTYEIMPNDVLKVDIEFSVTADDIVEVEEEKEVIIEEKMKEDIEKEKKEEEVMSRKEITEELTDLLEEDVKEDLLTPEEDISLILDEIEEKENEEEVERLDQESANMILNSASEKEDEFTTYYIHIVKTGDTIESIVVDYQTDIETLKKYNILEELNVGDKIIIPSLDE